MEASRISDLEAGFRFRSYQTRILAFLFRRSKYILIASIPLRGGRDRPQSLRSRQNVSSVPSTEELLRRYEAEILDVHHRSLALWPRPRPVSLYAMLSAFDSWAPLVHGVHATEATRHITAVKFKDVEEGLSHAMRWLYDGASSLNIEPTDDRDILAEAGEFLDHAADYATLAEHHVRYSQGLLTVEVNSAGKIVRFKTRSDRSFDLALLGLVEGVEDSNRRSGRLRRASRSAVAETNMLIRGIGHHLDRGRLVIDDFDVLSRPEVKDYIQSCLSEAEMTIPAESDLSGFSLSQFRAFWLALVRWSFACFILALAFAERVLGGHFTSTQVVARDDFEGKISLLSGLTPKIVSTIVDRLRYDGSSPKPDVFLMPLFCGDVSVAWSPLLIIRSRSERNLLKLMARTKALKSTADNLIGDRERSLLNGLGQLLARHGYAYKLMTRLSHGGNDGELDLLAYNAGTPEEVLLIEAKALLAADEIAETKAATDELIRAQGQLRRAEGILSRMPMQQKG
jgi:hypothetical protein